MNRKEASFILANIDRRVCDDELNEALDVAIKALEQEPYEDEYIKVPKKALKYRTAGMVAYNVEWLKDHFDLERAVICGAQQPCDNAVSRQAGIDIIDRWLSCDDYNEAERHIMRAMQSVLYDLPPVTPQPKIGHWIFDDECKEHGHCSRCGYGSVDLVDGDSHNYCRNCGARMVESQERSDKE